MQVSYLDSYEVLSLKLLAVQMYGEELKGLNCNTCEEKTKIENNCDMEYDHKPVYYHEGLNIDINTCPLNCIIPQHYVFFDKFIYYTETNANMPKYEDCDARFWVMYRSFTQYKNILLRGR